MALTPDPRVELARQRAMAEVVQKLALGGLHHVGGELTGPCPICGGTDRFSINVKKGVWLCRTCTPRGGDALSLVQFILSVDFMGAVGFLEGDRAVQITQAERDRRAALARREAEAREAEQARYRAYAKAAAVEIWRRAEPFAGSLASEYLAARAVDLSGLPHSFACLRFIPSHPYIKKLKGQRRELHRGPSLIAAIQGADGKFSAVHQTWFDPDHMGEKAVILHPETGEPMPAKLVQGSKKGGAIRLTGTDCASSLVMGEGIETTGSALVRAAVDGASYWAGVDLGNMSGKQVGLNSGEPDLSDVEAFVPPLEVESLFYIQDGDSAEVKTRAQLVAGCRRAMSKNPRLRARIVRAGDGIDLNDLVRGQAQ